MSNYSEKKLQRALHEHRYYTQKAPSSGHGILDPVTEDYIDQADIVAIRSHPLQVVLGDGEQETIIVPEVLVIEEKHRSLPACSIEDEEKQQLARIEEVTGGRAFFAVKWKNTRDDHRFFRPDELQDTGKHWKIERDQGGITIDEL